MSLFRLGDFTLSSGKRAPWKIDCDALSDTDIFTLADMIQHLVGGYSAVEGVPSGGARLARALRMSCFLGGPLLLVDDVLTSGASMERMKGLIEIPEQANGEVIGAVIFARGRCPAWIKPLFQMPEKFWL